MKPTLDSRGGGGVEWDQYLFIHGGVRILMIMSPSWSSVCGHMWPMQCSHQDIIERSKSFVYSSFFHECLRQIVRSMTCLRAVICQDDQMIWALRKEVDPGKGSPHLLLARTTTDQPANQPTNQPTSQPTIQPTNQPTNCLTN